MIFARKSHVFRAFFARFRRSIPAYRTGRRPGHSLRSRCVFYRRRCCRLVCGRCGGPYPSVWPTSWNTRHVQGLAARAAILNDRGADQRRSARPAGRGLFASTTKADRRHNGRPAQSLRYFRVGSFGFWEIGGIWGVSVRLRDNGGRRSPRAGRRGCLPQRSRTTCPGPFHQFNADRCRIILQTCAIWSTRRADKLPDNARQLTTQDRPTAANSNRSNSFSRFFGVFPRELSNQSNK